MELESQIDFSDEDGVNEENIDRMGVMCNDIIKQLGNLRNNSRLVDDVGEKKVFCWWVLPTQENHLCLIVCWEEQVYHV